MSEIEKASNFLKTEIGKKGIRQVLSFEQYLERVRKDPQKVLRSIFQLFYDTVKSYVGQGEDEYPDDPESIGFVKYDCSKIFEESSNPFFADRLFANRFVRRAEILKQGSQQNRVYIYEGPYGCGKSTFLNNLLQKFEEYTETEEGKSFEIFWEIEDEIEGREEKIQIPCPSHDHPLSIIPKNYRADFLEKLFYGEELAEIRGKIFNQKEYQWLFNGEACTICQSLFQALWEKFDSFDKALNAIKVRPYKFNRRLGEGVSIFNPGDKPRKELFLTDDQIQKKLDQFFGANLVKYIFSQHAKTNNGLYVLMDVKSHNKDRLLELHNIISEGVCKVNGIIEETVNSLFIALMNPEDRKGLEDEKGSESFQGRIQYNKIPYVLEPVTEVKVYHSIFGQQIDSHFLPRILENFAKVIISSRMKDCPPLKEWIPDIKKYDKYCDENGLLLRMALYSGVIPNWLSEEDKKKFTAPIRRKLISFAEQEGDQGFSGRKSLELFNDFYNRYSSKVKLINMNNVVDFFVNKEEQKDIPKSFNDSLVNEYDYTVLDEVKESLYFYNKEQIKEDILNYLWAINYDLGTKTRCKYTEKEIEVSIDFLKLIGSYLVGKELTDSEAQTHAQEVQKKRAQTVAKDPQKNPTETELYQELFDSYVKNLKERALQPFAESKNFREAVMAFGTQEFETFDSRLKEHVEHMIKNLIEKFGYTQQGAKEICLYVFDNKLVQKFS